MNRLTLTFMLAALTASATAQQYPQPTPGRRWPSLPKTTAGTSARRPADGGPLATGLSAALNARDIDKAVKKVADWQLAQSQPYFDRIWTWSVLYTGFMAASESTGDPKYRDAMMAMGRKYNFELRSRLPNADDQSVGSTYLDLYFLQPVAEQDQKLVLPTRAGARRGAAAEDAAPATPRRIPWWWCDALFMAPAVWAEMGRETEDPKYVAYLNAQWHADLRPALGQGRAPVRARCDVQGQARGEREEGLLVARRGLGAGRAGAGAGTAAGQRSQPAVLCAADAARCRRAVSELQDAKTGLWHAGLLDPAAYPLDEVSGSALFVYGMAYGVNHGYLDRKTYEPVIAQRVEGHPWPCVRGWAAGVQSSRRGLSRRSTIPTSSYNYGVGGFLLAGAELKKMVAAPAGYTKGGKGQK